jgi:RNA polymerase sigma-70 factor (ECF subfamily)
LAACGKFPGGGVATRLSDDGYTDALFRRNESDLKAYVKSKLGVSAAVDADDIVQEAFLRIAVQRDADRPDNPRGFLFRVARNLVFDTLRRNRVRRNYAESQCADLGHGSPGHETTSAESEVSTREELAIVIRAIDELPPQCRRVFLLQRQDGLSYAEIAGTLGISVSMVQKHMSKALARLYKVLP